MANFSEMSGIKQWATVVVGGAIVLPVTPTIGTPR